MATCTREQTRDQQSRAFGNLNTCDDDNGNLNTCDDDKYMKHSRIFMSSSYGSVDFLESKACLRSPPRSDSGLTVVAFPANLSLAGKSRRPCRGGPPPAPPLSPDDSCVRHVLLFLNMNQTTVFVRFAVETAVCATPRQRTAVLRRKRQH